LHSGEVVSGKLDSGSSIEQDVTGLTVHLASRIEHEAPPGEICLSRECQTLLRAYCDTETLGSRTLKGIPDPVEIFRLVGLKPAVNSEHFRGASLMPMRGRASELETLQRALTDTAPGSPRVIGILRTHRRRQKPACFRVRRMVPGTSDQGAGSACAGSQPLDAAVAGAGSTCAPSSASSLTWTPDWRGRGSSRP
jgi:adenylate cyclase